MKNIALKIKTREKRNYRTGYIPMSCSKTTNVRFWDTPKNLVSNIMSYAIRLSRYMEHL
jgi:hypothetical protein